MAEPKVYRITKGAGFSQGIVIRQADGVAPRDISGMALEVKHQAALGPLDLGIAGGDMTEGEAVISSTGFDTSASPTGIYPVEVWGTATAGAGEPEVLHKCYLAIEASPSDC